MNELFIQLCFLLSSQNQLNDPACENALKAAYIKSGGQQTYNLAQKYYENKLYSQISKETLNPIFVLGAIADTYNKKDLKVSAPFKPFCDTFSADFNEGSKSVNLGMKWLW